MSLKPVKASEQKRINEKAAGKKRAVKTSLPPYMYIVSEGTKTEPNYIKEMVDEINKKYFNYSQGKRIIVEGASKNTKGLLEYARESVEKKMPQAEVVYLLYDKDDFPKDNFDNTEYSTRGNDRRKYEAVWSNECFELWLVLHFQDMDSDTGRKHCREILRKHCNYKKNLEGIYEILKDKIPYAIKRAEKQYKNYPKNTPPSKMCPATKVFKLVKELLKYL